MSAMASLPSAITPRLKNSLNAGKSHSQFYIPSSTPQTHGLVPSANRISKGAHVNRRAFSSIIHAQMDNNHQPNAPQPKKTKPIWFNWFMGWIFSMILPLANLKGGNLLKLVGSLSQVEKAVEEVAETVEEVAEALEKVSSEVAENTQDNEMLKETALVVEKLSKEAEKDAKLTMKFMHKVDEIKEEVESEMKMVMKVKNVAGEGTGKAARREVGA